MLLYVYTLPGIVARIDEPKDEVRQKCRLGGRVGGEAGSSDVIEF